VSFEIWNVGIGKLEWAIIIGTSAIVSVCVCVKDNRYSITKVLRSYLGEVINGFGIILRQGSTRGILLALFSLGMYSVSLLFENTLTSRLVAPRKTPPFDLAELIGAGYRILINGQTTTEFASHLPYLLEEFDKFNLTFKQSLVEIVNTDILKNPGTFVEDKFSYFSIATGTGNEVIRQTIKSLVPERCGCPRMRNEFSQFPVYSFFQHKLTFQIFRSIQLFTEAGFCNFFDWDLERLAPVFDTKSKNTENSQASFDSYVSLNNLIPLLLISGFLVSSSFLTFSFELRNLAYRKFTRVI
jgi:hypothetical protein